MFWIATISIIAVGLILLDLGRMKRMQSEIRTAYMEDGLSYDEANRVAWYLIEMFIYMRKKKDCKLASMVVKSTMTIFRQRLYNNQAYEGNLAAKMQKEGIRDACLIFNMPVIEAADLMYSSVVASYEAYSKMEQEPVTKRKKWELPEELPHEVALFLSRATFVGGLTLVALWVGKGQIAFFLFSIVFLYVGRRSGWWLSRASLYGDPLPVIFVECVIWGGLVAYLTHALIVWHHPHWILQWVFGFGVGAYVSSPNYGLIAQGSIPDHAMPRHTLITSLPFLIFIIASVGLSLLR
jgi:hypothetical protein